jgi:FdhD protein
MLLEAARMGAPVFLSFNSATARAIELARMMGITVIGHARDGRFSVYSHPERIRGCPTLHD